MPMRFLTGFFLLIVCLFHSVWAQAVSLEDCKAQALKNNDLIVAYEALIQSDIYSWRKDKSSLFPQLTAFYQPDYIQFGGRSDLARKHGFETRAGSALSWDIQKILTDYPALSRLEIGKSRLLKSIAQNEILKNTTQDYYRLYMLLKKKRNYQDAEDFFQVHIKTIRQLQSKGVEVELDLNRAQVQLRSLGISLANLDNEINDVLIEFDSMMNAAYKEADFSVMDAPDMSVPNPGGEDYSRVEESLLDKTDVNIAEKEFEQSKFYYLPTIQLGLEHNSNTVDPNVEEFRSFLSLNFDIFDFGQKSNEVKQLKYNYQYQKNLFKDNQRKLNLHIEQIFNDVYALKLIYKSTLDNVNGADQSVKIARLYYKEGKIKETDLLSIFSDYLNAQDQSYQDLYDFMSQKAELEAILKEPGE